VSYLKKKNLKNESIRSFNVIVTKMTVNKSIFEMKIKIKLKASVNKALIGV